MKRNDNFTKIGEVKELLPNTMFRIAMDDGKLVLATLKGSLRKSYVRVFPGDRVRVEMTPYDEARGRIVGKL
jgi:translation initiation factor IF-1